MTLETETLKLRLIESQMLVLQYQHKEVSANIAALKTPPDDACKALADNGYTDA